MMLELYKEIELEYENPVSQDFMNVSVSYKNIEQRGEGRRMVFHCQGNEEGIPKHSNRIV